MNKKKKKIDTKNSKPRKPSMPNKPSEGFTKEIIVFSEKIHKNDFKLSNLILPDNCSYEDLIISYRNFGIVFEITKEIYVHNKSYDLDLEKYEKEMEVYNKKMKIYEERYKQYQFSLNQNEIKLNDIEIDSGFLYEV
jgi:hypothetical protein